MTDFAIYDMDRTVTRHATYTPFLLHCALRRAPLRLLLLPLVIASMLAYVLKLIDRGRLKEINHRLLLGHKRHPHELQPLVESFAARTVAANIRPGARSAIARDKAEGRRVVMATASYRLYAEAIGRLLGFDDGMVTDWLEKSGLERGHIRFYSDHASDAPAFEWADEAVAVNPHDRLRRLASERAWRVEDWG